MTRLALYQPDIPQNVGAAIRLSACLGVKLDIIEPCGFPWNDAKIRQAGLDYVESAEITKHMSWQAFRDAYAGHRLVLMTTKAAQPYTELAFRPGDILIAGRESAGVPDDVHDSADERVTIPMVSGMRSINVINASAMVLGEALRQRAGFP